ncbi:MAG: hypothetical protein R3245_09825 [Kiloniellales bacterium]|nr:hypothetical protein [Kiloniellales bacterium]
MIIILMLGLLLPGPAFALSCARPSLDQSAIDAAVMIFEGIAGPKRALAPGERKAVKSGAVGAIGGGLEDFGVYRFEVTKGWKGADFGQSVQVLFNNYWGDGFSEGGSYLVVATQQIGDLFWAPLCGHTIDVKHAADFGDLATLERLINESSNP